MHFIPPSHTFTLFLISLSPTSECIHFIFHLSFFPLYVLSLSELRCHIKLRDQLTSCFYSTMLIEFYNFSLSDL